MNPSLPDKNIAIGNSHLLDLAPATSAPDDVALARDQLQSQMKALLFGCTL